MDWNFILLAVLGLFLAGVVKGTTGLGYSTCALPFLTAALGLKSAIVLIVIPAMASNLALIFNAGHVRETVDRFWKLYLAILPGIGLGIGLLVWVDQELPTRILGLLIMLFALVTLLKPELRLPMEAGLRMQVPIGLLNGVLTGMTGSQAMPLIPYMMALELDSARLVQAINLAVVTASVFLGAGLIAAGLMPMHMLLFSVVMIIPALMGVQAGNTLRRFIPEKSVRLMILIVLMIMGLSLAVRL